VHFSPYWKNWEMKNAWLKNISEKEITEEVAIIRRATKKES
jgi:hypothetical protein